MPESKFETVALLDAEKKVIDEVATHLQDYPWFYVSVDLTGNVREAIRQGLLDYIDDEADREFLTGLINDSLLPALGRVKGEAFSFELRSIEPDDRISNEVYRPFHLDGSDYLMIVATSVPSQFAVGEFTYDMERYEQEEQYKEVEGVGFDAYIKSEIESGNMELVDAPIMDAYRIVRNGIHRMRLIETGTEDQQNVKRRVSIRFGY